ncbi:MAG: HEAT repeat domain-containing protein [Candidatus Hydrogenedentota bacterium]
MQRTLRILAVLLAAGALAQAAPNAKELVKMLGSEDRQVRITARQLLPREDVAVAADLLPLLAHEDQHVSWAAMRVLEDLANQATAPGREEDRHVVTDLLMKLVAADQPNEMKEKGLRILPKVVPQGYDIAPVVAILESEDAILREKARAALREMNTPDAAGALADALSGAEPDFQIALLDALARMQHPNTVDAIADMLESDSPDVQAAACLALSWTGTMDHLGRIAQVQQNLEGEQRASAARALVQEIDALAKAGGYYNRRVAHLSRLAREETDPSIRAMGIVALGQHAIPETVVARVTEVLDDGESAVLEPAALAAFRTFEGAAGAHALRGLYPKASRGMKLPLVRMFGEARDPLYMPVLEEAARQTHDPELQSAALDALVASGLPGAADLLAERARELKDAHSQAVENLKRLAENYRAAGNREEAGKTFLGIYQATDHEELRAYALEGIKQHPVPEAFDVLMKHLTPEEFDTLPVETLAGIAQVLFDTGRDEEAEQLAHEIIPRLSGPEALTVGMSALEDLPNLQERLGFVGQWYVIGPWPFSPADGFSEPDIDPGNIELDATYEAAGETLAWQWVDTDAPNGLVDLLGIVGMLENVCAYAYTEITVPEATEAQVRIGSDDGNRIWVNGKLVHQNHADRGSAPDQDVADVQLAAGVNKVLVQASQIVAGWNFMLRLTTPEGAPLSFDPMTKQ